MPSKKRADRVAASSQPARRRKHNPAPRWNAWAFRVFTFLASAMPLLVVLYNAWPVWLAVLSAAYLALMLMTVHVAQQWERVVVLRFGRFNRVEGPGVFFTVPFIETASLRVDQRIMVTPFSAEEALTADLVPTDIDAVLFWMVTDPKRAWCEVNNYPEAVSWAAQTALRDVVGRVNLADISTRRTQLDYELKEILNDKTGEWGVSVVSVEIRNILIPESLQEAMSREAQAQQESNARVILAEIEHQIAELYVDAAKAYREDELAFQIRMASMVNESVKESGGSLVVTPSAFSEGFDAGGMKDIGKLFGR